MRREAMQSLFEEVLSESISGTGGFHPGGTILTTSSGLVFYRAIWEWQNEVGIGGSDGATQSSYSYRSHWIQKNVFVASVILFMVIFSRFTINRQKSTCMLLSQLHHFDRRPMDGYPESRFR
jgi:hypothetical protein